MSTIDTSTWSPNSSLNTDIGGIPLNADASIQQTWQAIQMLMAALKGDTSAIELTINQPDGTTVVATNQTLTVVDNAHAHTIANVAGLQTALDGKAAGADMSGATASADGASGLVPAPEAGDQDKVLKGDGTWGTVTVAIDAALDAMLKTKIFPVGSTYFSLTDSRNPSVILGFGTWTAIEGRFLLGASSSYAADSIGGEAAHTLTASELPNPATYMTAQYLFEGEESATGAARFVVASYGSTKNLPAGKLSSNTATDQPHNNMPPYVAGHLWRRTA